jgi:leucyl-tRNA synthetase
MQVVNAVQEYQAAGGDPRAPEAAEATDLATRLLAPLAPHTAEGAWDRLGHPESVVLSPWPQADPEAQQSASQTLAVQVNGKLRAQIQVPAAATKPQIQEAALADPKVQRFTEGKPIAQVIVVPGKLVNVVVRD